MTLLYLYFFSYSWVQDQDKAEVWTDGVEDYLTYAKQLIKEYDDVIQSKGASAGTSNFGGGPGGSSVLNRLGGTGGASAAPAVTGFNFAPSSGAPTFGGFGGSNGTAAGTAAEDDEEAEETEEAGPSLELDSSNADILMSQRVKLMTQNAVERKWKDRGEGIVSIRRSKDGSGSPYLVFTTDAGRILLNAPLVKGLKPVVNPKALRNLIMFLISKVSADEPEERNMQLFKCASPEAQQELHAKIMELVGE